FLHFFMYLFTKTVFSSCPNEAYCRYMTILGLFTLFVQIFVAFMLLKEWKKTKSSYARFLAVVRTFHIFMNLLCFVIGEIRTLLPRKTIICYGIIRYLGDYGCSISLSLIILLILFELFAVVYAFNGQYNIMCRKVGFYDNTLIQNINFIIFIINSSVAFFILNFSLLSREEGINLWYTSDKTMKLYLKEYHAIITYGGAKDYLLFIFILFVAFPIIASGIHYFIIIKTMIKFICQLQEHNKQTSIKNDYVIELKNHIANALLPFIFLFWPFLYCVVVLIFFYDEKYYWFTEPTTNTITFFVIIYALVSALYVLFFKYRSIKRKKRTKAGRKTII
uniref:Serpentine receptor class gamma n=1 Tax=Strongyloides stercoralis TaxID=6248 RepID=A0AAF5DR64_STRER